MLLRKDLHDHGLPIALKETAMTIEELGNLGEFIAAIAVLVSLVYLAL